MNNTYKDGGVWNAALNALPKSQRKLYKLTQIAEVERKKVGTPSFRILNNIVGDGTVCPVNGHPWSL
jgi:hypothetical protein